MELVDYFQKKIDSLYRPSDNGFYCLKPGLEWKKKGNPRDSSQLINANYCSRKTVAFLRNLLKNSNSFDSVHDFSRVDIGELCYNVQLIKDDYEKHLSHSICINISILIPFFHLHILELRRKKDDFSKWIELPKRMKILEKSVYRNEVLTIKKYLRTNLELQEFPDELLNKKTPKVFTEDIPNENFTYYNAFFQREFDTR